MSENPIAAVIEKVPQLTDFGMGVCRERNRNQSERVDEMQRQQHALLASTEAFEKTCAWLEKIPKIKTINRRRTSYGLKHLAEHDIGYITNGVFIAAALHCGFDYKIVSGSPNVYFNMSERGLTNGRCI